MAASSSSVPTALVNPLEIEETSVGHWLLLFKAIGFPLGLSEANISHAAIVTALSTGTAPAKLADALETLRDLGDIDSQQALIDTLADAGLNEKQAENEGPREFALRLFVEQQKRPELEQPMLLASQANSMIRS